MKMPVLFVGHGNPMNAIEHNEFRESWSALGEPLPRPKAILCVSAHWETRSAYVTATDAPKTIHDFDGFPRALFEVRYPAPGEPALARRVAELVASAARALDPGRGLDHGTWSVLVAMYPDADVPVVQLSIDTAGPAAITTSSRARSRRCATRACWSMGSGNIVHNLRQFDFRDPTPLAWASALRRRGPGARRGGRHDALMVYPRTTEAPSPSDARALPAAAVRDCTATTRRAGRILQCQGPGSISMTSVLIGGPAEA